MNAKQRLTDRLANSAFSGVDGASLAVFRCVFGVAVAAYAVKALLVGEVRGIFVEPSFHFSYWGFSWVKPWPGNGMYLHFVALAVAGILVACGIAYRFSTLAMALLFSFVFLCDRTAYLNHMYLIMLICWMMVVVPGDRVASVDRLGRQVESQVPLWSVWLVRFHVALPYFFGGIAKLSADWLQGQPMRMTLGQLPTTALLSRFVGIETLVNLYAYGGLVFDLLIVPALLFRRTRFIAFVLVLVFHVANAVVFPIGVFPWLMIGATTIFFEPGWPRFKGSRSLREVPTGSGIPNAELSGRRKSLCAALVAYLVLQCLIPLRHLGTGSDPNWTERGHFFAWHMMLRGKRCGLRMYVTDTSNGQTSVADLREYVSAYQYPKVGRDPEHIRQLAHHIASEKNSGQPGRYEVRAFALVSLNGRKAQLLVDPAVNLATQKASWTMPAWIVRLDNPLLKQHWDVPLLDWESELNLDAGKLIGSGEGWSGDVRNQTTLSPAVLEPAIRFGFREFAKGQDRG